MGAEGRGGNERGAGEEQAGEGSISPRHSRQFWDSSTSPWHSPQFWDATGRAGYWGKGWDTGRKAALQGRFGLQLGGCPSLRHTPAHPLPGEGLMEPGKGDKLLWASQPQAPSLLTYLHEDFSQ